MFFIITSSIIVVSLIRSFFKIKRCAKHDKYLYKFCQLRRDIISYLRINHDIISKTEYLAIKQVLDLLNKTINLYSKNEAQNLFNIRKFAFFVKETKALSDSSKKFVECNNEVIKSFRNKLGSNIIDAFFAYTPFIFTEIFLKILYRVIRFFVKVQINKLKNFGDRLLALNEDFESIISRKT